MASEREGRSCDVERIDRFAEDVIPHEAIERLTAAGRGSIRPVHWKDKELYE